MSSKARSKSSLTKKILKLFDNYGLDTNQMEEDEIDRLIESYMKRGNIEEDLKESEKYKKVYEEDII